MKKQIIQGLESKRNKRIGEVRKMSCGQKATLVEYRSSEDCDIKFEDGTLVQHKTYQSFKRGYIPKPGERPNSRVCKDHLGNVYNSIIDMCERYDVLPSAYNARLKRGYSVEEALTTQIKPSGRDAGNKLRKERVGETRKMNNGISATLITYRNADDVDIQFEDGAVVLNKRYRDFWKGLIKHPKMGGQKDALKVNRVGERRLLNSGEWGTVHAYRKANDIDVIFDDGTIVHHRDYAQFKKGAIRKPDNRVGEINLMSNGMVGKIIAYRSSLDLDIRFEDGVIVENKTYENFKKGAISHPVIPAPNKIHNCQTLYGFKCYILPDKIRYTGTCKACGYHNFLTLEQMRQHKKICCNESC